MLLDDADPFLAVGMVSTCDAHGRAARSVVRRSVFATATTRERGVAWRFVVDCSAPSRLLELARSRLLDADVLHVPGVSEGGGSYALKQCSCAFKTRAWFAYALGRWPSARYVAKTEDDTFLHLGKLLHELTRPQLLAHPRLLYGLLNVCSAPSIDDEGDAARGCYVAERGPHTQCTLSHLRFPRRTS